MADLSKDWVWRRYRRLLLEQIGYIGSLTAVLVFGVAIAAITHQIDIISPIVFCGLLGISVAAIFKAFDVQRRQIDLEERIASLESQLQIGNFDSASQ